MKKLLFSFIALCMGMCAMAQSSVYVCKKNGKYTKYLIADLDSISFTEPFLPLSGVFTIAKGKTVKFASGNLQCTLSATDTIWKFATNQYDMLGTDNVIGGTISTDTTYGESKSGSALAEKIDLFGWSANNTTAPWGISTSEEDSIDYSGDFVDWGKNIGDGDAWRTLTKEEWLYLLNIRTNASEKKGIARLTLNDDGSQYINGLILLPDEWTDVEGVTFRTGFSTNYSSVQAYTLQTITLTDWQKLEAAGAVFLPTTGRRDGMEVKYVQCRGYYWADTPTDKKETYSKTQYMYFASNIARTSTSGRYYGRAVRLVQDVK